MDRRLANHIVSLYSIDKDMDKMENGRDIVSERQFLFEYISYARSEIHPTLTKEAAELLVVHY
jgi:DNA replication licensing factor MCM4